MLLIYIMVINNLKTHGLKEITFKFNNCFKSFLVTESMNFQKASDPIEELSNTLFKVIIIPIIEFTRPIIKDSR